MAVTFTATDVVNEGNDLTLQLHYNPPQNVQYNQNQMYGRSNPVPAPVLATVLSPEYQINCLVTFQAKVIQCGRTVLYLVRFESERDIDQLNYSLEYSHKFNRPDNKDKSEHCIIKNDRWQLIGEYQGDNCKFFVSVKLSISAWSDPFERLHDDTELTDLELRGMNGSVKFHKTVAAGFSQVIKTRFTGEWAKEDKYVMDAPPKTTQLTLQHLKDYMYADKLPNTGLQELLLIASYYIIPDLELRCVIELLTNVTDKEAYDLVEFAMKHQMSQLIFEIMYRVQIGVLNADVMRKHQKW